MRRSHTSLASWASSFSRIRGCRRKSGGFASHRRETAAPVCCSHAPHRQSKRRISATRPADACSYFSAPTTSSATTARFSRAAWRSLKRRGMKSMAAL